MDTIPSKQVQFHHALLQGTAYQAGRMQGEIIAAVPGWLAFIRSGKGAFSPDVFRQVMQFFDRYCPGVNEEIHGLADGAGIPVEDVVYYASTYLRATGCSHFAVLPAATENGHVLAARTFDFSDSSDDLRLCTTQIEGKYRHLGFSIMLFGRSEGMNEHGLIVTTSAGGIPVGPVRPPIQSGFQFWALVRAVLETCRTVDEALALAEGFPQCGNAILILADRGGAAALLEGYGPHHAVHQIGPDSPRPYLCATNHYALPEMGACQGEVMGNSLVRREAVTRFLETASRPVSMQPMQDFLSTPYPAGLSCHYYPEYFGTVHAMLFDATQGTARVCFGAPDANPWYSFDLAVPATPGAYPSILPQEQASPDFWKMVAPA